MDKEYFLNAGIPHPLHFEASMSAWQSLLPAQPPESFLNQNWGKSMDQYNTQFDSAIGSIVSSSHVALDSVVSNDRFAIRELIGKLGGTCNSGEISPPFMAGETATAPYGGGANTSCYGTTLNSQPKLLRTPTTDQSFKEKTQNPGNSIPSNFRFPALPSDHGFSDTAAIKFSCFENRTFNGRTNPIGLNNTEFPLRSDAPFPVTGNITRVLSSPSLPAAGFPTQNKFSTETQMETRSTRCSNLGSDKKLTESSAPASTSNNNSSVSEQIPIGEIEPKTPSELNSRKRKFASKGKQRDDSSIQPIIASKVTESEIDLNSKRSKLKEKCGNGNLDLKTEDEKRGSSTNSANPTANEPPKDYIHVRARRGQATDSHSLAERVRREKIGERMKLLQDLVPGCSKVTGKALMLDEIINYVQSLQRQVEFLSMKLASVNPSVDVKLDGLIPKNPNSPLDSSGAASYGHQAQRSPQLSTQINIVDGFGCFSQFQSFSEDDLQSIVQMGFLPKSRVQS